MGWQMYAHRYDKSADEGIDLNPIVEMDCGRNGEMEELLDLRGDLDADNAIDAGTKVSKQKIEEALRYCCRKHADGEDYIWEIQFFANLLINWPNKDRSVHILLS